MDISSQQLENLVGKFPSLNQDLEFLIGIFHKLHPILEREYQAVKEHDLIELQETMADKTALSTHFENRMNCLNERIIGLMSPFGSYQGLLSLREFEEFLENINQSVLGQSLLAKVWGKHFLALKMRLKKFRVVLEVCLPEVKKNKFIINQLLMNHQASLGFWQNIQKEVSQPYDSQGSLKDTKGNAHFYVKA